MKFGLVYVAQLAEQPALNRQVLGSKPSMRIYASYREARRQTANLHEAGSIPARCSKQKCFQYFAYVAKWYGSGLLTRIPQVRILSCALSFLVLPTPKKKGKKPYPQGKKIGVIAEMTL